MRPTRLPWRRRKQRPWRGLDLADRAGWPRGLKQRWPIRRAWCPRQREVHPPTWRRKMHPSFPPANREPWPPHPYGRTTRVNSTGFCSRRPGHWRKQPPFACGRCPWHRRHNQRAQWHQRRRSRPRVDTDRSAARCREVAAIVASQTRHRSQVPRSSRR